MSVDESLVQGSLESQENPSKTELMNIHQTLLKLTAQRTELNHMIGELKEQIVEAIKEIGPFLSVNKDGKDIVVFLNSKTGFKVDKAMLSQLTGDPPDKITPSVIVQYVQKGVLTYQDVLECEEENETHRLKTRRATRKDKRELQDRTLQPEPTVNPHGVQ